MSFWKIVKGLNWKQLRSLLVWFLKHPLYMLSTVQATMQTFQVSQREFPNIHGKHNKANAFRHAFWNVLIAKKCARFSGNTKSVLNWTEQITDWHEEFSPNEELPKVMDLHNNHIGRERYLEYGELQTEEIVKNMKEELGKAVKVNQVVDIQKYPNQLVYLED